jgi:hypothetical protein
MRRAIQLLSKFLTFLYTDGNWGQWSNYSACSTSCGIGLQIRSRECNNPAPANGGLQCPGDFGDVMFCNVTSCPSTAGEYLKNL